MSFLQHYWWAIVFGAIIAWWASSLWRGAKRLSTPPPAVQSPPLRTAFTRSEFEGKVGLVRKRIWMGVGAGLGMFVIGTLTLIVLGRAVPSIPQGDLEAAQLLVIVAALLSLFGFVMAGTRLIRRLGLICPVCRRELVDARDGVSTQDIVLGDGKCPQCGAPLLDPATR